MSAAKHFRGFATSALDGKGRFSLPAAFRNTLFDASNTRNNIQLRAVTTGPSPFVAGFPDAQLDIAQADIDAAHAAALARGEAYDREQAEADYFGSVVEASLDEGGRFAIPPVLRDYAGIVDGVVIQGAGRQIRFWRPEAFLATDPADPVARASCIAFIAEMNERRRKAKS